MIIGEPFYFALQFDVVEAWNSPKSIWRNGLFSLYINGERVFGIIDVVELKTTLGFYSKSPIEELCINNIENDAVDLYRNAEGYFTGDGEELFDGLFDLTCTAMEDGQCYLYFIKTDKGDRLVWSTDNGENVSEAMLPVGTIKEAIKKLQNIDL